MQMVSTDHRNSSAYKFLKLIIVFCFNSIKSLVLIKTYLKSSNLDQIQEIPSFSWHVLTMCCDNLDVQSVVGSGDAWQIQTLVESPALLLAKFERQCLNIYLFALFHSRYSRSFQRFCNCVSTCDSIIVVIFVVFFLCLQPIDSINYILSVQP